jgi:hypothetical protein
VVGAGGRLPDGLLFSRRRQLEQHLPPQEAAGCRCSCRALPGGAGSGSDKGGGSKSSSTSSGGRGCGRWVGPLSRASPMPWSLNPRLRPCKR